MDNEERNTKLEECIQGLMRLKAQGRLNAKIIITKRERAIKKGEPYPMFYDCVCMEEVDKATEKIESLIDFLKGEMK